MAGEGPTAIRVNEIAAAAALRTGQRVERRRGRNRRQPRERGRDKARDHFEQLAREVALIHDVLVQEKSRFRFCVHREGDHVMLDVVVLDENGTISEVKQKDITHEDFTRWLDHIASEEGIVLDSLV